ncbi:drug/metabolite transporter (DMT)-like permease [Natronocella acetinitrilica]|uniref:Drug/metabolite transporter (DMT)-like permease n=1 Tax=Natronocella acetinitrilica TaxID=414046 RepID=A0AAE3G929_9GAMM|nr:drug/metabolite transporter (DMT)-like permease [Natronocella acetinitrilica]
MFLLFGLLTAISFGVADFLAGLVGRKMAPLTLVLYSQSIGAVVITIVAISLGGRPSVAELAWGGAAGVVLGLGFILYYRALANGKMGIIAAVTGVWTAAAPFAIGLSLGERPSTIALIGIALVVVAIALVSGGAKSVEQGPAEQGGRRGGRSPGRRFQRGFLACDSGIFQATVAGLWLGLFFVFLDQPQSGSPLWPATAATVASALVVGVLVPALRPRLRVDLRSLWVVGIVGLCQTLGTLTFVIAAREGMLSVVAVAGALTPVPTAILAFLILRERATLLQLAGIAAALAGIVMMMQA